MNDVFREVVVDIPDRPVVSAHVRVLAIEGRFKVQLVDEALHNWSGLVARGAFCASNSPPESAAISISAVEKGESDGYRWAVQLENCDNRCLIVLANMLLGRTFQQQATAEGVSSEKLWCRRITIELSVGEGERKRYDFREFNTFVEDMYPDLANVMRSQVCFEGSGPPRSFRRMLVEFHTALAEARFDMLAETASLWRKVLTDGYPNTIEDLYNGDCSIEGITVDLCDDCALQVKVERFGGILSAWRPLINLLGGIRGDIARLRIF